MSEFHFLRPLWLLALPVAAGLAWYLLGARSSRGGWRAVVDSALQPYVLARPDALRGQRWPLVAALVASAVAALALAGPTWQRLPVPTFRSSEALVVVLDLSRSMDAGDLEPSRLERAKLKLLALLDRRKSGQTALVVFSAHAFTVTPLTTDTRTIASLVNALSSDIMPSRGSFPEAGLDRAGMLLSQTGLNQGEVLLVSDADVSSESIEAARRLARAGVTVSVLAVGTSEGAPIPTTGGGFVVDQSGRVVVPRLDLAGLRRLADAGGGRFAQLTPNERDLDTLLPDGAFAAGGSLRANDQDDDYRADVWRDEGVWLALLLLPLLAFGFRRGWIYVWVACVLAPTPRAEAFEWQDLWKRPDQQGYEAMQGERPEDAAELFDNREWRAAAQYRTGDYPNSAANLSGIDTADANYNRGNALARNGDLEAAIEAYDRALELDPGNEDAVYNRKLVEDLLKQQQQQQQQQNESSQGQNDSDSGESGEDGQSNEESASDEQQGQNGEQQRSADNEDNGPEQQSEDSSAGQQRDESGQDAGERNAENERDEQGSQPDQPQQAALGPEDVEQWASDQAADQWLRRIPQDPGGLLRRKFLYQYQRLGVDQDGNYVWPGDESRPW